MLCVSVVHVWFWQGMHCRLQLSRDPNSQATKSLLLESEEVNIETSSDHHLPISELRSAVLMVQIKIYTNKKKENIGQAKTMLLLSPYGCIIIQHNVNFQPPIIQNSRLIIYEVPFKTDTTQTSKYNSSKSFQRTATNNYHFKVFIYPNLRIYLAYKY
jgi:hypothetical protein